VPTDGTAQHRGCSEATRTTFRGNTTGGGFSNADGNQQPPSNGKLTATSATPFEYQSNYPSRGGRSHCATSPICFTDLANWHAFRRSPTLKPDGTMDGPPGIVQNGAYFEAFCPRNIIELRARATGSCWAHDRDFSCHGGRRRRGITTSGFIQPVDFLRATGPAAFPMIAVFALLNGLCTSATCTNEHSSFVKVHRNATGGSAARWSERSRDNLPNSCAGRRQHLCAAANMPAHRRSVRPVPAFGS